MLTVPSVGFPQIQWEGVQGDFYCVVISILGPNTQELFKFCNKQFSLKTILWIGIQMLNRLQVFHNHGYLHRDLKPESICIGAGKKAGIVHLTDFQLVKRFVCPNTGQHLKHLPNKGVIGTKRYISLNAHVGNQQSRADDLIALGTVLVSLFKKGSLPWDMAPPAKVILDNKDPLLYQKTLQIQKDQQKWDKKYLEAKMNCSHIQLTEGMPQQF